MINPRLFIRCKLLPKLFLFNFLLLSTWLSLSSAQSADDIWLYDDAPGAGIENWSWTSTDTAATDRVSAGSYSLYGEMRGFEAIYIGTDSPLPVADNGVLAFSIFTELDTEIVVVTSATGVGDGKPKVITPVGGQWQTYQIPLSDLGVEQEITGVWWQQFSELDSGGVYLDEIRIGSADSVNGGNGTKPDDAEDTEAMDDSQSDTTVAGDPGQDESGQDDSGQVDAGTVGTDVTEADAVNTFITIYDDSLREGFYDWSWTATDIRSQANVNSGEYAVYAEVNGWEAVFFGSTGAIDLPDKGSLEFSVYSINAATLGVQTTSAGDGDSVPVLVSTLPGQWQNVSIPLSEFGAATTFTGVWWQQFDSADSGGVYLDDIRITGTTSPGTDTPIRLSVSTGSANIERRVVDPASGTVFTSTVEFPHRISEDIYGINFAPDTLREELEVPVSRWGGNAVERYNYLTSSSNQALDWYFANNPMEPAADSVFETENQRDGTDSILTVPMLGWVSSGREGVCSYPVSEFGSQDDSVFHWIDTAKECGNGYRNGQFLGVLDPAITSIEVDEQFVADWVSSLVAAHGTAADGGVEYYALGNEPGLWHSTHGDVQATPMSRADIIDKNIKYGLAIKSTDPTAEVIGPVLWGSSSYYVSSDELLAGQRPGDVSYFLSDYLTAMADAEQSSGRRILDRLAVNFYDQRVYDGGTDKLRLESTRHLWDSSYAPADWWVVRDFLYGNGSAVIPRLRSAVDEYYPGTRLALTEYHFGGATTGVGALAQIDALGIFGRESLDLATLWEPYADYVSTPEAEFSDMPLFWAFRLFRNYNGEGGKFGDTSLYAASTDETKVSVYAARRSSDGALTLVVVNKTIESVPLLLEGIEGTASGFQYRAEDARAITPIGLMALDGSDELPGYSATLIVLEAQ